MTTSQTLVFPQENLVGWEPAMYAFLVEKQRQPGSLHGKGVSGKDSSPVTIGARMACLSSLFRFLQRMDIVASNPCDKLERRSPRPTFVG